MSLISRCAALALLLLCAAAFAAPTLPLKTDLSPSQALTRPACSVAEQAGFSACRALVLYNTDIRPSERYFRAHGLGADVFYNYAHASALAVVVPRADVLRALQADPGVQRIIPDRRIEVVKKPAHAGGEDTTSSNQQVSAGVARLGALTTGFTGAGVGVAIADTGVDDFHPDLNLQPNCFTAYSSCADGHGHGTHVAGIVAALNNDQGVVGVAPDAALHAVKVLSDSGSGSDATIMAGLDWVLQQGGSIRVVNMSLGRPGTVNDNPALHQLVQQLAAQHVIVVVAAGNDARSEVWQQIPAAYPEVVSVASTTAEAGSSRCRYAAGIAADTASYFTTDGSGISISAPGARRENISRGCFIQSEGILSLAPGGGLARMSGTSMAAPHVAGAVAQYLQRNPGWGVNEVKQQLAADADQVGVLPKDSPTSSYSFDGVREGVLQLD